MSESNPPSRDLPEAIDSEPQPSRRFFHQPTLIERAASWALLVAAVLAFAVFYYAVIGSGGCDETLEQCEAFFGPYQVR